VVEAANGAEVVGEDLGCVPEYVRPHLLEIGVPGFKVCHWEVDDKNHAVMPEEHPECAFATYTTHDHPPIMTMWEELREKALEKREGSEESAEGLRIICEYAGIEIEEKVEDYPAFDRELKWVLLGALLRSEARYAGMMIHDLLGNPARINLPGTVGEYNWTHRVKWGLDDVPSEVEEEFERLSSLIGEGMG